MAKTDEKTLKLIAEVKRRKEEIAEAEKPNYTTNMSFTFRDDGGRPVNLHVEKNISRLVSIAAFLMREGTDYEEASKILGVDVGEFQWAGFTVDEWLGDLTTRINKLQIANKKKQLATLETRLDKIVSPELRAEMELAQIEQELGNS